MGLRGPKADERPLFERAAERLEYDPNSGCWLWPGARSGIGYGVISRLKIPYYIHRISYEHHKGPIPRDKFVCHKCDQPLCSNPDHLFLATPMQNTHDMMAKGRCIKKRLTQEHIAEIHQLLKERKLSQKEIGLQYGVDQTTISGIKRRRYWFLGKES